MSRPVRLLLRAAAVRQRGAAWRSRRVLRAAPLVGRPRRRVLFWRPALRHMCSAAAAAAEDAQQTLAAAQDASLPVEERSAHYRALLKRCARLRDATRALELFSQLEALLAPAQPDAEAHSLVLVALCHRQHVEPATAMLGAMHFSNIDPLPNAVNAYCAMMAVTLSGDGSLQEASNLETLVATIRPHVVAVHSQTLLAAIHRLAPTVHHAFAAELLEHLAQRGEGEGEGEGAVSEGELSQAKMALLLADPDSTPADYVQHLTVTLRRMAEQGDAHWQRAEWSSVLEELLRDLARSEGDAFVKQLLALRRAVADCLKQHPELQRPVRVMVARALVKMLSWGVPGTFSVKRVPRVRTFGPHRTGGKGAGFSLEGADYNQMKCAVEGAEGADALAVARRRERMAYFERTPVLPSVADAATRQLVLQWLRDTLDELMSDAQALRGPLVWSIAQTAIVWQSIYMQSMSAHPQWRSHIAPVYWQTHAILGDFFANLPWELLHFDWSFLTGSEAPGGFRYVANRRMELVRNVFGCLLAATAKLAPVAADGPLQLAPPFSADVLRMMGALHNFERSLPSSMKFVHYVLPPAQSVVPPALLRRAYLLLHEAHLAAGLSPQPMFLQAMMRALTSYWRLAVTPQKNAEGFAQRLPDLQLCADVVLRAAAEVQLEEPGDEEGEREEGTQTSNFLQWQRDMGDDTVLPAAFHLIIDVARQMHQAARRLPIAQARSVSKRTRQLATVYLRLARSQPLLELRPADCVEASILLFHRASHEVPALLYDDTLRPFMHSAVGMRSLGPEHVLRLVWTALLHGHPRIAADMLRHIRDSYAAADVARAAEDHPPAVLPAVIALRLHEDPYALQFLQPLATSADKRLRGQLPLLTRFALHCAHSDDDDDDDDDPDDLDDYDGTDEFGGDDFRSTHRRAMARVEQFGPIDTRGQPLQGALNDIFMAWNSSRFERPDHPLVKQKFNPGFSLHASLEYLRLLRSHADLGSQAVRFLLSVVYDKHARSRNKNWRPILRAAVLETLPHLRPSAMLQLLRGALAKKKRLLYPEGVPAALLLDVVWAMTRSYEELHFWSTLADFERLAGLPLFAGRQGEQELRRFLVEVCDKFPHCDRASPPSQREKLLALQRRVLGDGPPPLAQ